MQIRDRKQGGLRRGSERKRALKKTKASR